MSSRKPRLTASEHEEMGRRLHHVREEMIEALREMWRAYPKADVDTRRLQTALDQLDMARMGLDTKLYNEHPSEFNTHAYYPGPNGHDS